MRIPVGAEAEPAGIVKFAVAPLMFCPLRATVTTPEP
jgi:hypothetical protein